MLATSDAVLAAWLSPARQLAIRVQVAQSSYGSEDVTSLSFDSGSISGEVYQIGSTYMNTVQIVFPSIVETIKEDQEVIPELGILVDGEYHYSKLGHFFITEFNRDRNAKTTTITASDKMIYMEGVYESKLTYPIAYRDVALEVANLAGVEINQVSFSSLGIGAIKKPEGYTFRQAIGLIAQFEGGFASFNRDGELEIRRLRPTEFEVTPESYLLKGFSKNENAYRIGGITVRTGEEETDVLRVGSTNGSQIELENKVMTQTLLNNMWELVKTLIYFPFELKWRGSPVLEAGDWMYVTDRDGNRYSVPNLSYSLTFNGGLSGESKATTNSSSQATYKYRGPLNQRVDRIDSILNANNWNTNYYDATEPPNPKEGDLWFKPNGQDMEIWSYEKDAEGNLSWVLQISSAPNQELLDEIQNAVDAADDAVAIANAGSTIAEYAQEIANAANDLATQAKEDLLNLTGVVDGTLKKVSDLENGYSVLVAEVQGQETRLANVELTADGLTTTVASVQEEMGVVNTQIAEIQVSAEGVKSTVANLVNSQGNLIPNANLSDSSAWGTSAGVEVGVSDVKVNAAFSASIITQGSVPWPTISSQFLKETSLQLIGKTVTISAYVYIPGGQMISPEYFYFELCGYPTTTTGNNASLIRVIIPSNEFIFDRWIRYSATLEIPETNTNGANNYYRFLMRANNSDFVTEGFKMYYACPQVEVASEATPWGMADTASQSQISQLAENINLRVEKDNVINQINVSPEGILIDGDNIWITGKTKIDNGVIGTAQIQDASISNAKIISVNANKISAGTIDTTKITIYGGSSTNYVQITNSRLDQYGVFDRTWQGTTTKHQTTTSMLNGYFRAWNSSLDRALYVSDFGISTFADGDGGGLSSGTIAFFDRTFNSAVNGVTITSNYGTVGLRGTGSSGRVWLESESTLFLDSTQGGISIRPARDARSGSNAFNFGVSTSTNASEQNGYIMYGSEETSPQFASGLRFYKAASNVRVSVVDNAFSTGGSTVMEAGVGQFNSVDARDGVNQTGFNQKRTSMMNLFAGKTSDGTKRLWSDYLYATSGSGKALHITSGGTIVAYSSSERFKEQILLAEDVDYKALLDLDLKSWIYKSSYSLQLEGEPIRRVYGLIAEDVERAGLTQYTEYNQAGQVEGYKPELWTLTIPILSEHEKEIQELKAKVKQLENEIRVLQAA